MIVGAHRWLLWAAAALFEAWVSVSSFEDGFVLGMVIGPPATLLFLTLTICTWRDRR